MSDRFLITCEHGGKRIPPRYRPLFEGREALLHSHRGYDPGALRLARDLAAALDAPLVVATISRLLVDLNRSIGHPRLYSEATRQAPAAVRREILARYYLPYRRRAEAQVAALLEQGGRVLHIATHSFTPALDGVERRADVGLLYDPARPGEAALCDRWQTILRARARDLRVRRNYPYAGRADGFTTYLRRHFPADRYVGIELEVNQRHVRAGGRHWRALRELLVATLREALAAPGEG